MVMDERRQSQVIDELAAADDLLERAWILVNRVSISLDEEAALEPETEEAVQELSSSISAARDLKARASVALDKENSPQLMRMKAIWGWR